MGANLANILDAGMRIAVSCPTAQLDGSLTVLIFLISSNRNNLLTFSPFQLPVSGATAVFTNISMVLPLGGVHRLTFSVVGQSITPSILNVTITSGKFAFAICFDVMDA